MNRIKFPIRYKAIQIESYQQNIVRAMLSLKLVEKEIIGIGEDELLVKMEAASCNPSDIAFLQGGYNVIKPLPAIPGFEGSGRVVAAGKSLQNMHVLGKRVAVFVQSDDAGTWSEYLKIKPHQMILHHQNLSLEQSAGFFVNPFTAFGMFELALEKQSRAIVVNAAGSVLASYMNAFAKQFSIKTIGIVRKKETVQKLQDENWDEVLLSTEEDFEDKLKRISKAWNADIAYDAVGGEMTGQLTNQMPPKSMVVVYGGLSGKAIGSIHPLPLIFFEQNIRGFNLNYWLKSASEDKIKLTARTIEELMLENKLVNKVQVQVNAKDIASGLKQYLGNMSDGKLLITF